MTVADVVAALALPSAAMVNQRVAKQMLADNAAATAADKRSILDSIDEIQWLAALKPSNIGVPEFRDGTRSYLEVAVLSLNVRAGAKTARLVELVHRAIPYPVLLIVHDEYSLALSLAHIRHAHNEADKTVLDGESVFATLPGDAIGHSCLQAMALPRQPRSDFFALYQGWIDTVMALQAAQLTGHFTASVSREQAAMRRAALRQCHDLTTQMAALRKEAAKEKQLARQVDLNMALLRLTSDLTIAKQRL
ncbi:MAG: DUF4391 domain-containing protein [Burkholderiales bacterium]|nr:DUF4391 domain-containing protein [Burkholderiales bacterium]